MSFGGIVFQDAVSAALGRAIIQVPADIEDEVLKIAIDALDYAKQNAPWTDRTGDARAGLDTDVSWDGDVIVWTLFHTVPYGQWLETIESGKFAIIMPTLEQFAGEVGNHLQITEDFA